MRSHHPYSVILQVSLQRNERSFLVLTSRQLIDDVCEDENNAVRIKSHKKDLSWKLTNDNGKKYIDKTSSWCFAGYTKIPTMNSFGFQSRDAFGRSWASRIAHCLQTVSQVQSVPFTCNMDLVCVNQFIFKKNPLIPNY